MAKDFFTSNSPIARAVSTKIFEYTDEDGKKVTETEYVVKLSMSGAVKGAAIGAMLGGPRGAVIGGTAGAILGSAD